MPEAIEGYLTRQDALAALYREWRQRYGRLGEGLAQGEYRPEQGEELSAEQREAKQRARKVSAEHYRRKRLALARAAKMPAAPGEVVRLPFETGPVPAPPQAPLPKAVARKLRDESRRQQEADKARAQGWKVCDGCLRIRHPGKQPGRGFCYLTSYRRRMLCGRCLSRAKTDNPQQEQAHEYRERGEPGVPAADGGDGSGARTCATGAGTLVV